MCTEYECKKGYRDYVEQFSQTRLPLIFPEAHAAPNLEPQDRVRLTNTAPIFRRRDNGVELAMLRWWLLPYWYRGTLKEFKSPTFNARAETVRTLRSFKDAFAKRRCLVPVDAWTEWTGPPKQKTKWSIRPRGDEPICFAGLWDRAKTSDAGEVESYTLVTQATNPPLLAYHPRSPVVLRRAEWETWLDLDANVDPLMTRGSQDWFDITYVSGPEPPGRQLH
jgi:putative SOS response-associated peptidase YedK